MRGLKQGEAITMGWLDEVASFTDAWIETKTYEERKKAQRVASFTDAWIETVQRYTQLVP